MGLGGRSHRPPKARGQVGEHKKWAGSDRRGGAYDGLIAFDTHAMLLEIKIAQAKLY
jgi:hypothetical protein